MPIANKVTLCEREYSFYIMPPSEAFPLLFSFFKTFGKTIAPLVASEDVPHDAVIAQCIESLSQGPSDQVLHLFSSIFRYVRQNGCPIIIDEHFSGRNKELLQVFFYALVFNFADFLDESLLTFASQSLTASTRSI